MARKSTVLLELSEDEHAALAHLADLGKKLAKGQDWDAHLASIWKKDPETGDDVLDEKIVLNIGDLKALARL